MKEILKLLNGENMGIRKHEEDEINDILEKIEVLSKDEYYKYYFDENGEDNYPHSAYLVDEQYYIDFTYYDDNCFMGVINLNKNQTKNSIYNVLKLLDMKLKEYKVIWQWCFLENKTALKFHNFLKRK